MPHPHRLHAQAAAWSLHTARARLIEQATAEAAQIAAEQLEAAALLHSPAWGRRHALGGHSDPVGGAAVYSAEPAVRVNRRAVLAGSTTGTLAWLADQLAAPDALDPLRRLQAAIPGMQPGTCATLTRWLRDLDDRIRNALGMPPDLWPLPGAPACPACNVRLLRAQTSASDTAAWTVICTAGCVCSGDGCPCGMPVRVKSVGHIWGAGSDLVARAAGRVLVARAVAGATPAQGAARSV